MIEFKSRRINTAFIKECENALLDGDSLVLLSPRFGGKRFVQEELIRNLHEKGHRPVCWFSTSGGNKPSELAALRFYFQHPDEEKPRQLRGDPLQYIEDFSGQGSPKAFFLVTNLDLLPQSVAWKFLQRLRAMVEQRSLVGVLSGESDFREMVHGTHSEFNCATQYILHGFDREIFGRMFDREAANVSWECASRAADLVWEETLGNAHITRLLIAVAKHVQNCRRAAAAEITDEVLELALQTDVIPAAYWTGVLRRPLELVTGEPDCAEDLEKLLVSGKVRARTLDGAPGILEMSGLAVRNEFELKFASPFMKRLAERHFTPRRRADLFAQGGQWPEAFDRYQKLPSSEWTRPSDGEDRSATNLLIQSLTSALLGAATKGTEEVWLLLEKGARFLLGFPEVALWRRKKSWAPVEGKSALQNHVERQVADCLPSSAKDPAPISLPDSVGRFAVAIGVPGAREEDSAVVLSTLGTRQVLSKERKDHAERLLCCFAQAHRQAANSEFNAKRLETRERHVQILNGIFDFIGGHVFNVRQILELTGNALLPLGYSRVMFSLVDSAREQIRGVLDCPSSIPVKLASLTDYSLMGQVKDIQQHVVRTGRTHVVESADEEALVNPRARELARLKAFAVLPIVDRKGCAVGTIHIERSDSKAPTRQEVEDLELFGRQLSRVLALDTRMTHLHGALEGSSEPLLITNLVGDVVFANRSAAELFAIQSGWQDQPGNLFPAKATSDEDGRELVVRDTLGNAIKAALQGHRSVCQAQQFGIDPTYRCEIVCDALRDWRGQIIGALIDVHDLRGVLRVVDAMARIGQASTFDSALDAVLDSLVSFGFAQVRMYRIDPVSNRLTSYRSRGLSTEMTERFESGKILLPPEDDKHHAWMSIHEKEPILFYFGHPNARNLGIKYTPYDLPARVLTNPSFPQDFPKQLGDYWLSLPLLGKKPFGKIMIPCDETLRPDVFETLVLVTARVTELLLARQLADAEVREAAIREGVEKSVSMVAHNLSSRLASLPVILQRYRIAEELFPQIVPINEDLSTVVSHTMKTVGRAMQLLANVNPEYAEFDLRVVLAKVLQTFLSGDRYSISGEMTVPMTGDPLALESAFVEMVQNSCELAKKPEEVTVRVRLEYVKKHDWIQIHVEDNGPGIAREHKHRVFEDFFSHRPGKKRSTGLGLAFTRRVIAAHGGTIEERGTLGRGACFVIDLPVWGLVRR